MHPWHDHPAKGRYNLPSMKSLRKQQSDERQLQVSKLLEQLDAAFERRRAGDYAAALSEFESLESKSTLPQDIAALQLFQCMCLTDLGRTDEAHERISRVNKNRLVVIDQIDYESEYARIKRAQGKTSEALERIERAIKMAEAMENRRQVEEAWGSMQALRGILLAESGNCDEAIPVLESVPAEAEGWAEARIQLGDCKIQKRLHHEAIQVYQCIVSSSKKIHPIHRKTALRNIGCAYYYLREYTNAVEYLTKIEHGYDENPRLKAELFEVLATAYSRLGMLQEAARYSAFSKGSGSVQ